MSAMSLDGASDDPDRHLWLDGTPREEDDYLYSRAPRSNLPPPPAYMPAQSQAILNDLPPPPPRNSYLGHSAFGNQSVPHAGPSGSSGSLWPSSAQFNAASTFPAPPRISSTTNQYGSGPTLHSTMPPAYPIAYDSSGQTHHQQSTMHVPQQPQPFNPPSQSVPGSWPESPVPGYTSLSNVADSSPWGNPAAAWESSTSTSGHYGDAVWGQLEERPSTSTTSRSRDSRSSSSVISTSEADLSDTWDVDSHRRGRTRGRSSRNARNRTPVDRHSWSRTHSSRHSRAPSSSRDFVSEANINPPWSLASLSSVSTVRPATVADDRSSSSSAASDATWTQNTRPDISRPRRPSPSMEDLVNATIAPFLDVDDDPVPPRRAEPERQGFSENMIREANVINRRAEDEQERSSQWPASSASTQSIRDYQHSTTTRSRHGHPPPSTVYYSSERSRRSTRAPPTPLTSNALENVRRIYKTKQPFYPSENEPSIFDVMRGDVNPSTIAPSTAQSSNRPPSHSQRHRHRDRSRERRSDRHTTISNPPFDDQFQPDSTPNRRQGTSRSSYVESSYGASSFTRPRSPSRSPSRSRSDAFPPSSWHSRPRSRSRSTRDVLPSSSWRSRSRSRSQSRSRRHHTNRSASNTAEFPATASTYSSRNTANNSRSRPYEDEQEEDEHPSRHRHHRRSRPRNNDYDWEEQHISLSGNSRERLSFWTLPVSETNPTRLYTRMRRTRIPTPDSERRSRARERRRGGEEREERSRRRGRRGNQIRGWEEEGSWGERTERRVGGW
ncbi:unnamed protein product [Periconia digitata]|uniref:Uncharacterized protein n=1 Tax=Periconia digitata TaxID=1303443 RepID=A0A9W4U6W9_9PLEO|nr:unnamed protein product [Periconia digitata]